MAAQQPRHMAHHQGRDLCCARAASRSGLGFSQQRQRGCEPSARGRATEADQGRWVWVRVLLLPGWFVHGHGRQRLEAAGHQRVPEGHQTRRRQPAAGANIARHASGLPPCSRRCLAAGLAAAAVCGQGELKEFAIAKRLEVSLSRPGQPPLDTAAGLQLAAAPLTIMEAAEAITQGRLDPSTSFVRVKQMPDSTGWQSLADLKPLSGKRSESRSGVAVVRAQSTARVPAPRRHDQRRD